jgi:hypothetical protein
MENVRTPAPFPPPDEELCENFGRTMYYAQKLEKEFKLFLLTIEALGNIKIDKKNFNSVENYLLNNKSQNLGRLIEILKAGNGLSDESLKELLVNALQDRNKLAHSLFANVNPERMTARIKQNLIKELGRIRLSVGNAFLIMREFRKVTEEKIGITEEQLQEKLDCWDASE